MHITLKPAFLPSYTLATDIDFTNKLFCCGCRLLLFLMLEIVIIIILIALF